MHNEEEHWYALKVFYNRVAEVEGLLRRQSVTTYIPMIRVESATPFTQKVTYVPAISSLMFIRHTERFVLELQSQMRTKYPLMAYFNRETKKPIAIPDREMNAFICVTSAGDPALEFIEGEGSPYQLGDRVRVIGGLFKGAEGYIKRIKGNKRLVVSIEGVVAVATTYIPGCLLERIGGSVGGLQK